MSFMAEHAPDLGKPVIDRADLLKKLWVTRERTENGVVFTPAWFEFSPRCRALKSSVSVVQRFLLHTERLSFPGAESGSQSSHRCQTEAQRV